MGTLNGSSDHNLASNGAHSIRSKTESRLAASELVDDLKLKGIQRAVFEKIVHDSLNGAGDSDWECLRHECWPLRRDGKVDETVTRGGVANAVEHVQEKVVAWSRRRSVQIAIVDVPQGKKPKKWRAEFSYAPAEDIDETRPEFSWWVAGAGEKRSLAVWVPIFDKESIEVNVDPSDPWENPAAIPGYTSFREATWHEYGEQRIREGLPPPTNTCHWNVEEWVPRPKATGGYPGVHLLVHRTQFKDFIATTEQLTRTIQVAHQAYPVEDLLRKTWKPDDHEHFPPAANLLAVDVNVITSDRKLVVRKERSDGPWQTAVFDYVDALQDVHRNDIHIPAPRETAFRKCCQLLGFSIQPAFIRWVGVGLGTKDGNVSLFGEIEVSFTFDQLRERFGSRPDKISSKEIKGIDLTPEAIRDLLGPSINRHRRHMEVALVLSVWRRCPKMKIETKRPSRQDNKAPMKEKQK